MMSEVRKVTAVQVGGEVMGLAKAKRIAHGLRVTLADCGCDRPYPTVERHAEVGHMLDLLLMEIGPDAREHILALRDLAKAQETQEDADLPF